MAAAAAQIVSYSFSGTVNDAGVDYEGFFGPPGGSLAGDQVEVTLSYDPLDFGYDPSDPAPLSSPITGHNDYFALTATAISITIKINGVTQTLTGHTALSHEVYDPYPIGQIRGGGNSLVEALVENSLPSELFTAIIDYIPVGNPTLGDPGECQASCRSGFVMIPALSLRSLRWW
jgi:hypothetical protein